MKENIKEEIIEILPKRIKKIFEIIQFDYGKLMEIRLRANKPLIILFDNREYFFDEIKRELVEEKDEIFQCDKNKIFIVSENEIKEILQYISNYSLYAYEREIKQGFLTLKGGHRVGIAGKVANEGEKIKTISHIAYINIRVAHEIIGCANSIMHKLYKDKISNDGNICNTLIISPPCCGKTTLLRDIVRNISTGHYMRGTLQKGINVGLIDERSEIAACYKGIAQNDVGIRTDILHNCSKVEGMYMLLRTMSPKVIAVDEIGGRKDYDAILKCENSGCNLIATVHGDDIEDVKKRNKIMNDILENNMFERFIVLSNKNGIGNGIKVLDVRGENIV